MEQLAPGPGEVLVHMHFAGVNGGCETFRVRAEHAFKSNLDKVQTRTTTAQQESSASCFTPQLVGESPAPPSPATHCGGFFLLGAEGAGVVAAVGPGVNRLQVGQAVAVNGAAAFAEYAIAKERLVFPLDSDKPGSAAAPGSASPSDQQQAGLQAAAPTAEAVALVLSGLTAAAALEGTAGIQAGDWVAVTAAAGGTGHFAVQLALLAGCSVVAVVGGAHKVAAIRQLGDRLLTRPGQQLVVVDYTCQAVVAEVQRCCPHGLDVVYEGVGGQMRLDLMRCLAPGGRLLQVGYISEYPHAVGYPTPSHSKPGQQQQQQQQQQGGQQGGMQGQQQQLGSGMASGGKGGEEWWCQVPTAELMFWSGQEHCGPEGRRVLGRIWPSDPAAVARAKARVFDLHHKGMLTALVDVQPGGIQAVPDAIDYMLRGQHIGKVVVDLRSGRGS
ncbi:hypothetical protein QJQ45_022245 [Haematococcus lacustris]|nr:hypothetical protein QJQ45_022245 [Haematococcus lacustris]